MKTIFNSLLSTVLVLFTFQTFAQDLPNDEVIMGEKYENDVFYSMKDGVVGTANRGNWDIAFKTSRIDASIITNGGNNVKLFTYPKGDITAYNNVDTTGLSTWNVQYNSIEKWTDGGAFNAQATAAQFDFGWGVYNPVNHKVVGDSLFIIQLSDGNFKKIKIDEKDSMPNIYYFTYANLDGSDEITKALELNAYSKKEFLYYSLENNEILDREPEAKWDLLFTKFTTYISTPMGSQYYPVTGALQKSGILANKFENVDKQTYTDWEKEALSANISTIGYDWKTFNMQTYSYDITDNLVYFTKDNDNNIYKLYFTAFEASEGKFVFKSELIGPSGVEQIDQLKLAKAFPTRFNNQLHIAISNATNTEVPIKIFSTTSQVMATATIFPNSTEAIIDTQSLPMGAYVVVIGEGKNRLGTIKVMKVSK